MIRRLILLISLLAFKSMVSDAFSAGGTIKTSYPKASLTNLAATRRSLLQHASRCLTVGAAPLILGVRSANAAREVTGAASGNLPELPFEAQRSYLQYRYPLQLSADFYIFDLQTMVGDTGK